MVTRGVSGVLGPAGRREGSRDILQPHRRQAGNFVRHVLPQLVP